MIVIGGTLLAQETLRVCGILVLLLILRLQENDETRKLRRQLEAEETKFGRDSLEVASCLQVLAVHIRETLRPEEAVPILRRALTIEEETYGPDDLRLSFTLYELGMCLSEARLPEAAVLRFSRASEIQTAALGPRHLLLNYTGGALGRCKAQTERSFMARDCVSWRDQVAIQNPMYVHDTRMWRPMCRKVFQETGDALD